MNVNAEKFTAQFPIGTPVKYFPIAGEDHYEETQIRSEAWPLGHGEVVVKVKGRAGGVSIKHIKKFD